jgi:hypothetical protein
MGFQNAESHAETPDTEYRKEMADPELRRAGGGSMNPVLN